MEKKMYSLTYCYEGVGDSTPFASTLAVSDDIEKLTKYMKECVAEDCREPESDDEEWDDDCNYSVWKEFEGDESEVYLRHNADNNLYASYKIKQVKVL